MCQAFSVWRGLGPSSNFILMATPWEILFSLFYRWGNWGSDYLSKPPKVTQLVNDGAKLQTQSLLWKLWCYPRCHLPSVVWWTLPAVPLDESYITLWGSMCFRFPLSWPCPVTFSHPKVWEKLSVNWIFTPSSDHIEKIKTPLLVLLASNSNFSVLMYYHVILGKRLNFSLLTY